jgi:hypothetical protein
MANMSLEECYRVLELPTGATLAEALVAHRKLVRVWHPDNFATSPDLKADAEAKLKKLNAAMEGIEEHFDERASNSSESATDSGVGKTPRPTRPRPPTDSRVSEEKRILSQAWKWAIFWVVAIGVWRSWNEPSTPSPTGLARSQQLDTTNSGVNPADGEGGVMSALSSLDFYISERRRRLDQRLKESKESGDDRSDLDRFIDSRHQRLVRKNQTRQAFKTEQARENPITAGNEIGGVLTGAAHGAGSLVVPLVRVVSDDAADFIQETSAAALEAQRQKVDANIKSHDLGDIRAFGLGTARKFVNRYLPGAVCLIAQAACLGLVCAIAAVAGFASDVEERFSSEGHSAGLIECGLMMGRNTG